MSSPSLPRPSSELNVTPMAVGIVTEGMRRAAGGAI
jgi:hypothetical protein